jgi:glycosyltransferase involved in cell wall biosynthesis
MNSDTVSIIIPVYNRLTLLIRALTSVIEQSYTNIEIIVIDDGSTQPVQATLKDLYPHVIVAQQPHAGVSAARNHGIRLASGNWVAFLDSDDEWLAEKLSLQMQYLNAHPDYKVCHSEEIWIRSGTRVNAMKKHAKCGGWIFQHCLPLCAISPSSVIIHRSIFDSVGTFDESLPACEDYDLWLRLTSRFPVLFIEQALIKKYGGHEDQLSRQYWGMDRFRITALQNIVNSGHLNADDRKAATTQLLKKITVYLQGARKRNKYAEIVYYEALYQQYKPAP